MSETTPVTAEALGASVLIIDGHLRELGSAILHARDLVSRTTRPLSSSRAATRTGRLLNELADIEARRLELRPLIEEIATEIAQFQAAHGEPMKNEREAEERDRAFEPTLTAGQEPGQVGTDADGNPVIADGRGEVTDATDGHGDSEGGAGAGDPGDGDAGGSVEPEGGRGAEGAEDGDRGGDESLSVGPDDSAG